MPKKRSYSKNHNFVNFSYFQQKFEGRIYI